MQNRHTSNELMKLVVAAAARRFVSGKEYINKLKQQAETSEEIKKKYKFNFIGATIVNEPFTVDAACIPGTNFIAAEGPARLEEVSQHIKILC